MRLAPNVTRGSSRWPVLKFDKTGHLELPLITMGANRGSYAEPVLPVHALVEIKIHWFKFLALATKNTCQCTFCPKMVYMCNKFIFFVTYMQIFDTHA